jgi:hypothetical protein
MAIGFLLVLLILTVLLVAGSVLFIRWLNADSGTDKGERKRIMEMVAAGKISSEEGKELLEALGRSSALRGEEKFSRADVVMLVAVALVVLGFFLPWVHIRSTTQMFGRISGYQAGYHAGALGWAVFVIALLSAVPVFVTPKGFLYKISMLQIFLALVGLVLVISILVRAGSHLGVGLIVCLAGFIIGLIASRAKFKRLAA